MRGKSPHTSQAARTRLAALASATLVGAAVLVLAHYCGISPAVALMAAAAAGGAVALLNRRPGSAHLSRQAEVSTLIFPPESKLGNGRGARWLK